jgi:ribose 5-phosphate isomerase B
MSSDAGGTVRVALGSDHAGFHLKEVIREHLEGRNLVPVDLGTKEPDPVDYPDFAREVCGAVLSGAVEKGILLCGTGLGMAMMANRFRGIRAALCHDHFTASAARRHNDSNVLVLGGRIIGPDLGKEIVDTWLDTPFEGGRHGRRIAKLDE